MQIVFIERMSRIMTVQVDVILEHISIFFFEITWYLEMCRWYLSRVSFIVTFLH